MAIGMPLLELIMLFGVGYTIKRIKGEGILGVIRDFLFVRAERKIFYAYLATLALVVGFPWAVEVSVQHIAKDGSTNALVQFANDNTILVSMAYLAIVTIGYAIYAYIIVNRNKDKYSKEKISHLHRISNGS